MILLKIDDSAKRMIFILEKNSMRVFSYFRKEHKKSSLMIQTFKSKKTERVEEEEQKKNNRSANYFGIIQLASYPSKQLKSTRE